VSLAAEHLLRRHTAHACLGWHRTPTRQIKRKPETLCFTP